MFKIDTDKTIRLTRGDEANIEFSIEDYQFQPGDLIIFSITEKGNESEVVFRKNIIIEEENDSMIINLTKEETKIGEIINKEKKYWYEISLNDSTTVIGYDEDGPKLLVLYPESGDDR